MIEYKTPISGWHEVTKEQAKRCVLNSLNGMPAIPQDKKVDYINNKKLRGITVEALMELSEEEDCSIHD